MKLIKTGITPRWINLCWGKRPDVFCIALESSVSYLQPARGFTLCINRRRRSGQTALVHLYSCNGSNTIHGGKPLHSHWHGSMCLTAQKSLLHLNSSDLALFPVTATYCCQESKLHNQNNADQRMRKSELNKTISVLLPLVQHQASRQFVTVSTPRVPHVGQPLKGHVQVS